MKYLLILFLLLPSLVLADTFTWSAPIVRTDGTTIDPNLDIKSYKFYRGSGLVAATLTKPSANVPPPTTIDWSPPVGTTQYWVTAVDQFGSEGPVSTKVTVVVTPAPTATPTPTNTPLPPLAAPGDFARQ